MMPIHITYLVGEIESAHGVKCYLSQSTAEAFEALKDGIDNEAAPAELRQRLADYWRCHTPENEAEARGDDAISRLLSELCQPGQTAARTRLVSEIEAARAVVFHLSNPTYDAWCALEDGIENGAAPSELRQLLADYLGCRTAQGEAEVCCDAAMSRLLTELRRPA